MIDNILFRFIINILPLDKAGSAIRTGFLDPPFREVPFAIAVAMLFAVGNAWWRDGGEYTLRRAIILRRTSVFIGLWIVILLVFILLGYLLNPLLLLSWYLVWALLGSLGCAFVVWGAVYASTADTLPLKDGVRLDTTSSQAELSPTSICVGALPCDVVGNVVAEATLSEQQFPQEDEQGALAASSNQTVSSFSMDVVPLGQKVSHHGHYFNNPQPAEKRKAKQRLRRVFAERQSHLRHKSRRAS